ncbi:unnamed protein product, partial [Oppiella nova]
LKYPQLEYQNYILVKFLEPIIAGRSVLLDEDTVIQEIIDLHPALPLHISDERALLSVVGLLCCHITTAYELLSLATLLPSHHTCLMYPLQSYLCRTYSTFQYAFSRRQPFLNGARL